MRISTLMGLGRTMLLPIAGVHLSPAYAPTHGCAWGMVNVAAPSLWSKIYNLTNLGIFVHLPCRCTGDIMKGGMIFSPTTGEETLSIAVVHLFNDHVMTRNDWTMDQLIDWVRSVEPADPEEDKDAANPQTVSERDEVLSLR